jgi:hypothetical protein
LLASVCFFLSTHDSHATDRIGILISKKSVLSFDQDITDVDIDTNDYIFKVKGQNLLIRAKQENAPTATLLIRYGYDKTMTYVAEIFPDDKAPVHIIIPRQSSLSKGTSPLVEEEAAGNGGVFADNQKQQYTWFAVQEEGVTFMVSNIMHKDENTYIRIFIDNKTNVNLKLSYHAFEYITKLRKWLFFTNKQRNRVNPILVPINLEVAPMQFKNFDFIIPTYTSNGGLDVSLGESEQGIRKYTINIPSKVLLQAPRK